MAMTAILSMGVSPISCNQKGSAPDTTVSSCTNGGGTASFSFTGTVQSFTVPCGVTSVSITAAGAAGGENTQRGYPGGYGASIASTQFSVNPGDSLEVVVGGTGAPHAPYYDAGAGGGGGTAVYNTTQGKLLVLMGGGGGAGGGVYSAGCDASTTTAANNCGGGRGQNTALLGTAGSGGTYGLCSSATCTDNGYSYSTGPGAGGGTHLDAGGSSSSTGNVWTPLAGGGGAGLGAVGGSAGFQGGDGGYGAGGGGGGAYNGAGGGGGYRGGGGGNGYGNTSATLTGSLGGGGGSYCASACTISATSSGNGSVTMVY